MSAARELRGGEVSQAIRRHRLIVVMRHIGPRERLLTLADELGDAGARAFEVTMDAPTAQDDLAALRSHLALRRDGPYLVGAGTVLHRQQLRAAHRAGADFAVAPILDLGLLRESIEGSMPFIPGALTPTEIAAAWMAGATFVKLFPASAVGAAMVRELHGPLPDIALIPTGGVDGANVAGFLQAGAAAVGIGGAIVRADAATRRAIVQSVATS